MTGTRALRPFVVVATQNPADMVGTYPLPEAQLDRFLMRVRLDYPDSTEESRLLLDHHAGNVAMGAAKVVSAAEFAAMTEHTKSLDVTRHLTEYLVALVRATRNDSRVEIGASPRAGIALLRAARVHAAADGRSFVEPDDVQALAEPVLTHRLVFGPTVEATSAAAEDVVARIVKSTLVSHR